MTSTYPCNADILLKNRFVLELIPQSRKIEAEKAKGKRKESINMNCELITEEDFIQSINDYISTSKKYKHLVHKHYTEDYSKFPSFCS